MGGLVTITFTRLFSVHSRQLQYEQVIMVYAGHFNAVQDHVGGGQHKGSAFPHHGYYFAVALFGPVFLSSRFFYKVDHIGKKARGTAQGPTLFRQALAQSFQQ